MESFKSLLEAKLWVMRQVAYVQKTKSPGLNYSFASESSLIEALRDPMIEAGITMTPTGVEVLSETSWQTSSGGTNRCLLIRRLFVFRHHPSGDSEEVVVLGQAADVSDKAAPKAMTIAKKYALREFFMIETGDDPDFVVESREEENFAVYKRACTALQGSPNLESLEDKYKRIKAQTGWKEIQLQHIDVLYKSRKAALQTDGAVGASKKGH